MKKLRKLILLLATAIVALVVLTACGNANSETYKRYLAEPGHPTIGNVYVDPNRDVNKPAGGTEADTSGTTGDADTDGTSDNSGNTDTGGAGDLFGVGGDEAPVC
jgi:hypothetical protein